MPFQQVFGLRTAANAFLTFADERMGAYLRQADGRSRTTHGENFKYD